MEKKAAGQRGLLWAGTWKPWNTVKGGGGGIDKDGNDSVAPATALAGHQVKEGGRAPNDCSRRGERTEAEEAEPGISKRDKNGGKEV